MFQNLSRKLIGNRFSSQIYSINSVQYHTNTKNVSRLNQTFENSLKRNVNSPIISSSLCCHKRQFSISSSRNYCKNDESEKPPKKFWPIEYDDDEVEVGFPSLLGLIGIWMQTLKIRSNYMPTFDRREFIQGSKIAMETIIGKIAEGDFDSLRGLVTDELFDQIKESFGALTYEERQKFIIEKDEMLAHAIRNIDILEDEESTSIEILVVTHAIKNLSEINNSDSKDEFLNENLYVLNYRFVKDVTDEDWTVNLIIHTRLADEMEEQKKKWIKKMETFQEPFSKKK